MSGPPRTPQSQLLAAATYIQYLLYSPMRLLPVSCPRLALFGQRGAIDAALRQDKKLARPVPSECPMTNRSAPTRTRHDRDALARGFLLPLHHTILYSTVGIRASVAPDLVGAMQEALEEF
nr:hypothetical protein CFP56_11662 [Quercus suber]